MHNLGLTRFIQINKRELVAELQAEDTKGKVFKVKLTLPEDVFYEGEVGASVIRAAFIAAFADLNRIEELKS